MEKYLIWSHEHGAWWKPRSLGYTTDIRYAGMYSQESAKDIVTNATFDWTKPPNEVPVCISDLPVDTQLMVGIE